MMRNTLLFSCFLLACDETPEEPVYVPIPLTAGAPMAGVASGFLRLPAGVPLGGYTSRDAAFGGTRTRPRDLRKSPWAHKFHPSAGQLTGVPLQTLWLTNGDRHMVVLRIDLIGAFDGIVHEVSQRLSVITGLALEGQVAMVTSHSHASPAAHHQSLQFALGFDRYDPRVFERIVAQAVAQALAAHSALVPAKLGYGLMPEADPQGPNNLWRDRRSENDHLTTMDGTVSGPGFKDPSAAILKVESESGDLLAVLLNVGLHGTTFDDDNPWTHWDAPGAVAYGLSARLQGVPVFLLQGAGGDTSPAGRGDTAMARVDDLARRAGARFLPLVQGTETSASAITMDMVSLTLPQDHQSIRVTRRGSANFSYAPITLDAYGQPEQAADNQIFADDGSVIQTIDEFPALQGAGLCGEAVGVPFGSLGMGFAQVTAYPYDRCAILDRLMPVIASRYEVDLDTVLGGTADAPVNVEPAMAYSMVAFGHLGELPITVVGNDGGAQTSLGRVGLMFLPGETTTLYTLRAKRYLTDLGYAGAMVVGYAMDHEGYLMTVEDWVQGGYEPSINVWGPLQGEYLLEGAYALAERALAGTQVRVDDLGVASVDYGGASLGFEALPDADLPTPTGGSLVEVLPEAGVLLPLNLDPERIDARASAAAVRALTDVYAGTFEGGDVTIDAPVVALEREVDGTFVPVVGGDGLPVTSDGPGVLLGYSPRPVRAVDATRQHFWTVVWQPVGDGAHDGAWAQIELGLHRFVATGHVRRAEGEELEPYRVELPPFDVVPTPISVAVDGGSTALRYAPSPMGYRARDEVQTPGAAALLPVGMIVRLTCQQDNVVTFDADVQVGEQGTVAWERPDDGSTCSVADPYGNGGTLEP